MTETKGVSDRNWRTAERHGKPCLGIVQLPFAVCLSVRAAEGAVRRHSAGARPRRGSSARVGLRRPGAPDANIRGVGLPVITGAHAIIYSTDAEADRAFLRDVLGFPNVDAGDGWLIFGLPPAELAIHPGDENDRHELYLMTDNVEATVASLKEQGITVSPVADRGWGLLTQVNAPGRWEARRLPAEAREPARTSVRAEARRAAVLGLAGSSNPGGVHEDHGTSSDHAEIVRATSRSAYFASDRNDRGFQAG